MIQYDIYIYIYIRYSYIIIYTHVSDFVLGIYCSVCTYKNSRQNLISCVCDFVYNVSCTVYFRPSSSTPVGLYTKQYGWYVWLPLSEHQLESTFPRTTWSLVVSFSRISTVSVLPRNLQLQYTVVDPLPPDVGWRGVPEHAIRCWWFPCLVPSGKLTWLWKITIFK